MFGPDGSLPAGPGYKTHVSASALKARQRRDCLHGCADDARVRARGHGRGRRVRAGAQGRHRDRGRHHPALGVSHGGGGVVARRAEVALPVDQRGAHHPRLREPDEGVVDRGVAVRVVVAHHVADDAGALHVAAVRPVAAVVHRVEHAAVHRLEAVAHVRQGAADDDRHRVVDVAALHLLLEVDRLDAVAGRGLRHSSDLHRSVHSSGQSRRSSGPSECRDGLGEPVTTRRWTASDIQEPDVAGVAGEQENGIGADRRGQPGVDVPARLQRSRSAGGGRERGRSLPVPSGGHPGAPGARGRAPSART